MAGGPKDSKPLTAQEVAEIKAFREVVAGGPYTPQQTTTAPATSGTSFAAAQTPAKKDGPSIFESAFKKAAAFIGLDKQTFDKGMITIGLAGRSLPNPFGKEHYVVPEDPSKPQKSMLPNREPGTTINLMQQPASPPGPTGPGGSV